MGDLQHEEGVPHNSGPQNSSSFNADEPPMVFQCSQCNVIVGDSTAWVCVDDISRTITLKNITSAVVEDLEMKIASTGFDAGSTYYKMICGTCREEIGRKYKGAVNHLDPARGKYTLFVDKLSSYQIGSYDKDTADSSVDMSDILSLAKVKDMNTEISRLGSIMHEISERLQMLEQGYLPLGGDNTTSVKSLSYPSSCVSVPPRLTTPSPQANRLYSNCQVQQPRPNHNNDGVFKIPHARHPHPSSGFPYSSSVQSAYSHLDQFHKIDQQERPLGVDPEETFQSHTHFHHQPVRSINGNRNLYGNQNIHGNRNIHGNNVRQQRRNSLHLESTPMNFRQGPPSNRRVQRDFSRNEQDGDKRGKCEDEEDRNGVSSTMQSKSNKRKETSPEDPLQAMMTRRRKRRI